MKKAERLNGIIYILKEKGKLTAHELAEYFEVSVRTIYRDIDALSQLKVPIISHDGVLGGYEIDMEYFIPSIKLNEAEVLMLLLVLNYGETIRLPNLSGDYQILKGKIINTLTDVDQLKINKLMTRIIFGDHRVEPTDYIPSVLTGILESFIQECNLLVTYYNPRRNDSSERLVSPQKLFFEEGGWYLSAYCHLRQEKRVFRLDRIKAIKVTKDVNTYLDVEVSSKTDKYSGQEYLFNIEPALFRVLKENDYFKNVELVNAQSKTLTIRFYTRYKDDIKNIVLNNPGSIKVLEPDSFKREIQALVLNLYENYKS